MELSKNYNHKESEDTIFDLWEKDGFFHAEPDFSKTPFCIVIPPPNVTGVLHMGHALNNTIQDILIRKARMDGKNTRWVVGTDHAGIATQNVVERKLKKENLSRYDLGRERFLEEVWKWKDEHGSTIINQLKKMGCSCDYSTERFTMDEGLAFAVKKAFVWLFEKDLIYRGDRMIHWCPRCLTALSDEEAEHKEAGGQLYTIKYPFSDGSGFIQVSTTRPETLLGDSGVAVNPDDERYKVLQGKDVVIPFVDRPVKIIPDSFVDPAFGTGMVKVTPAHDPNDYEMGLRHGLEVINVMTDDGIMNEHAGPYKGLDRFECRKKIVEDLKQAGLLEKIEAHEMAIRQCYRCHTVVEPRVSKQWFVKMKPLADKALSVFHDGNPSFYPNRFANIYERWLEGIKDWCISRQIWWGHQIPVWYCQNEGCNEMVVSLEDQPQKCPHCNGKDLVQDTDVLDTWFSSWLWPFSTMGWPEKTNDLDYFYPTHVLTTAQEIIFFWVARMVMAGLEFTGKCPFEKVYIHGTVRDETGLKMSKSYGNVIDPLKIIDGYGADALRFSLMMIASRGNDIYLSDKKFEIGRNFATKIWNASRFLLMNLGGKKFTLDSYQKYSDSFSNDDKFILFKVREMCRIVDQSINDFRFNDAALCLYDFFWKNLCDRYIESVKIYFAEEDENKERSLAILFHALGNFLLCLQPFMPFISESLWQILKTVDDSLSSLVSKARYPEIVYEKEDIVWQWIEEKYELIKAGRNLRNEFNISPKATVSFIIKTDDTRKDFLAEEVASMERFMKATVRIDSDFIPSSPLPSVVGPMGTLFLELDKNLIDFEKEREKIRLKIEERETLEQKIEKKLANPQFIEKAKSEVVEKEREKLSEIKMELSKLKDTQRFLQ